jgi:hypothetical protein
MVRRVVGSLQWVIAGKAKEGIFTRVLNDGVHADAGAEAADYKRTKGEESNTKQYSLEIEREMEKGDINEEKEKGANEKVDKKASEEITKGEKEKEGQEKEEREEQEKEKELDGPGGNFSEARKNQRKKHRGSKVSILPIPSLPAGVLLPSPFPLPSSFLFISFLTYLD